MPATADRISGIASIYFMEFCGSHATSIGCCDLAKHGAFHGVLNSSAGAAGSKLGLKQGQDLPSEILSAIESIEFEQ